LDRAPVRERSPDRLIFGREREPEAVETGPLDLRGQLPPRRLFEYETNGASVADPLGRALDDGSPELLGIPRSTVHHLARRGQLPAGRVGRRWLFLRERIAAAVAPLDDPTAWRSERDADRR
jgi:excisionase family DNA binding protein